MYSHAYDQLDLGRIIQLAAENPLQVTQEVHGLYYEKKFPGAPEQEVQEFAFKKYWTMRALHSKLYNVSSKSKNRQSNDEKISEDGHHSVEIRLSESSTFEDYKSYIDRNRKILERMMKSIGDFWSIKARHTYQFMKNENIDSFKKQHGHALSNFIPQSMDRTVFDLMKFCHDVGDVTIHSDRKPKTPVDFTKNINAYSDNSAFRSDSPHLDDNLFNFYCYYTSLVWRRALFSDIYLTLPRTIESPLGGPYKIYTHERLITQDLARSGCEYNTIVSNAQSSPRRKIVEIGAGYGRLCEYFLNNEKCTYFIVDILPSIYLAEQYLKARFGERSVFSLQKIESFESVENKINESRVVILSPEQLSMFPDKYFDVTININSFMEMSKQEVEKYFGEIDRLCRGVFYSKQWKQNKLKPNVEDFRIDNYPVKSHWTKVFERPDSLHSDFFEQVWRIPTA